LRAPIGLAYLLARTSDTIADSGGAPSEVRLRHLAAFEKMAVEGCRDGLDALQREITPIAEGERILIQQVSACLDWLEAQSASDRAEICDVLRKIVRGQTLDLQRFPATANGAVTALQTADELEEYTYLVAGCVGEFWTRICSQHLPGYSATPEAELCRLGINFGKGLQLVNVLRDLPADLATGRCYLPAQELASAGLSPAELLVEPSRALPVFQAWVAHAREYLDDGREYISRLRPARIRIGCFLPWRLGVKTLNLISSQNPLQTVERVKVSRGAVYGSLVVGLYAAISNAPLQPQRA
jgi:farnesyl-diphosphate farnesyltransferase